MPSKNSKVISGRVPNRVDFKGESVGKILTSAYDLWEEGFIDIIDGEIVFEDEDIEKRCYHRLSQRLRPILESISAFLDEKC